MRNLSEKELSIVRNLILSGEGENDHLLSQLEVIRASELDDSGMGSLRFSSQGVNQRRFGKIHAEAECVDSDGVSILLSLYLDDCGNLFELDVWKVDFSPTIQLPQLSEFEYRKPVKPRPPQGKKVGRSIMSLFKNKSNQ